MQAKPRVTLTIRVPVELDQALRQEALRLGRTVNALIVEELEGAFLKKAVGE